MKTADTFESVPKVEGDLRTFYPNKPLAQTAANRGQEEYGALGVYSATAQFEPDHGFVAVLFSEVNIPAAWDAGFEVVLPFRPVKTPDDWASKKKPPRVAADGTAAVEAEPRSGATARVHTIAEELFQAGTIANRSGRGAVVDACIAAGINPSTASTQWSKFAKLKGW